MNDPVDLREMGLNLFRLREMGKEIRPLAHQLAAQLGRGLNRNGHDVAGVLLSLTQSKKRVYRVSRRLVPVPVGLVAAAIAILLSQPRPKLGRPRKLSTYAALKLTQTQQASFRRAARLIAEETPEESSENIRSRLRGLKRSPKKGKKLR